MKKLNEYFLMDDAHLYPGFGAIPELEHALITWYGKRFAVTLEKEEIYPLLGEKTVLHIFRLPYLMKVMSCLFPTLVIRDLLVPRS